MTLFLEVASLHLPTTQLSESFLNRPLTAQSTQSTAMHTLAPTPSNSAPNEPAGSFSGYSHAVTSPAASDLTQQHSSKPCSHSESFQMRKMFIWHPVHLELVHSHIATAELKCRWTSRGRSRTDTFCIRGSQVYAVQITANDHKLQISIEFKSRWKMLRLRTTSQDAYITWCQLLQQNIGLVRAPIGTPQLDGNDHRRSSRAAVRGSTFGTPDWPRQPVNNDEKQGGNSLTGDAGQPSLLNLDSLSSEETPSNHNQHISAKTEEGRESGPFARAVSGSSSFGRFGSSLGTLPSRYTQKFSTSTEEERGSNSLSSDVHENSSSSRIKSSQGETWWQFIEPINSIAEEEEGEEDIYAPRQESFSYNWPTWEQRRRQVPLRGSGEPSVISERFSEFPRLSEFQYDDPNHDYFGRPALSIHDMHPCPVFPAWPSRDSSHQLDRILAWRSTPIRSTGTWLVQLQERVSLTVLVKATWLLCTKLIQDSSDRLGIYISAAQRTLAESIMFLFTKYSKTTVCELPGTGRN